MSKYNEKIYSFAYALKNIDVYFWKIYLIDLFEYSKISNEKSSLIEII